MIIIRALAFLLFFTVIPFAVGRLITYRARTGLITDYLIGFLGNLGIFYILYSIIFWIQIWITTNDPVSGAFSLLSKMYYIVTGALLVVWLVSERNNYKKLFPKLQSKGKQAAEKIKSDKFVAVYAVLFVAVLLIQMYMAYRYEINEWSYDDFDYVVSSQDTISYDALSYINYIDGTRPNVAEKRAVASWTSYIALLAKVSGFEVTTVCHTILPVMLLLVSYLVFYYIAKFIFTESDNRLIFMLILSVANIFGLYSHYSATFRLLGAIWQGKAVLTVIGIPLFTIYLIRTLNRENRRGFFLPIMMISLGATSLTSLTLVFLPIVAVLVWVMMCINKRRIYGLDTLVAALVGPIYQIGLYILVWMLQQDMQSNDFKYFPFRKRNDWWYKWFH